MKRKYTRKVKPDKELEQNFKDSCKDTGKPVLDNVQPKSDGFKYSDLPLSLRKEIEHIIEGRKRLNLFDDTVERKERAVRYYIWRNHVD